MAISYAIERNASSSTYPTRLRIVPCRGSNRRWNCQFCQLTSLPEIMKLVPSGWDISTRDSGARDSMASSLSSSTSKSVGGASPPAKESVKSLTSIASTSNKTLSPSIGRANALDDGKIPSPLWPLISKQSNRTNRSLTGSATSPK